MKIIMGLLINFEVAKLWQLEILSQDHVTGTQLKEGPASVEKSVWIRSRCSGGLAMWCASLTQTSFIISQWKTSQPFIVSAIVHFWIYRVWLCLAPNHEAGLTSMTWKPYKIRHGRSVRRDFRNYRIWKLDFLRVGKVRSWAVQSDICKKKKSDLGWICLLSERSAWCLSYKPKLKPAAVYLSLVWWLKMDNESSQYFKVCVVSCAVARKYWPIKELDHFLWLGFYYICSLME